MTSQEIMEANWPHTVKACIETFFDRQTFGRTLVNGNNEAGFMLSCLTRYEEIWRQRHGHRPIGRWALDQAAAQEIRYQWSRGRHYNRPAAALGKCIQMLPIERPEKIFTVAAGPRRQIEDATTQPGTRAQSDRRGHGAGPFDLPVLPRAV